MGPESTPRAGSWQRRQAAAAAGPVSTGPGVAPASRAALPASSQQAAMKSVAQRTMIEPRSVDGVVGLFVADETEIDRKDAEHLLVLQGPGSRPRDRRMRDDAAGLHREESVECLLRVALAEERAANGALLHDVLPEPEERRIAVALGAPHGPAAGVVGVERREAHLRLAPVAGHRLVLRTAPVRLDHRHERLTAWGHRRDAAATVDGQRKRVKGASVLGLAELSRAVLVLDDVPARDPLVVARVAAEALGHGARVAGRALHPLVAGDRVRGGPRDDGAPEELAGPLDREHHLTVLLEDVRIRPPLAGQGHPRAGAHGVGVLARLAHG